MVETKMGEKEIGELIDLLDRTLEHRYGLGVKDALDRINTMNRELGQVIETVTKINTTMVTKEIFNLEMRNLTTKTEAIEKRVDDWRDSTKTYFTVLGAIIAIVGIVVPILIVIFTRVPP